MKRYYFAPNKVWPTNFYFEVYGEGMADGHMLVVSTQPIPRNLLPAGWIDLGHPLCGKPIAKYCAGCMGTITAPGSVTVQTDATSTAIKPQPAITASTLVPEYALILAEKFHPLFEP